MIRDVIGFGREIRIGRFRWQEKHERRRRKKNVPGRHEIRKKNEKVKKVKKHEKTRSLTGVSGFGFFLFFIRSFFNLIVRLEKHNPCSNQHHKSTDCVTYMIINQCV